MTKHKPLIPDKVKNGLDSLKTQVREQLAQINHALTEKAIYFTHPDHAISRYRLQLTYKITQEPITHEPIPVHVKYDLQSPVGKRFQAFLDSICQPLVFDLVSGTWRPYVPCTDVETTEEEEDK